MNTFLPPNDRNTINFLSGLSGPGSQPLNNLNDSWLENVKLLQAGDIMVCGGDFVQAASPEYCFPKKKDGVLDITAQEAANWNVNRDVSRVCSKPKELNACKNGRTTDGTLYDIECICPCEPSTYKASASGKLLITETINAMGRGAKIVFIDDFVFIADVYPDNKAGHDYVYTTLQNASNNLNIGANPQCKGGGFYWYQFGQAWSARDYNLSLHAKITTFYFLSKNKPYLTTTLGSFNPSYPISLTLEIGGVVTGLLENTFCKAAAYFVFDTLTAVINSAYNGGNPSQYGPIQGKVWSPTKGSGFAQGGCPPPQQYQGQEDTSPMHCTIPPCSKDDVNGFFEPWYMIAAALGADMTKPAKWWNGLSAVDWYVDWAPVYGEDTFANDEITTDINFCGLAFCSDYIKKNKYGDTNEQRITFTEKNVKIKIGAEPTTLFPRFHYGLALVNSIFLEAEKYVKVGIMTSMTAGPACTLDESTWFLGPGHTLPMHPLQKADKNADPPTGQFMQFVNKGLPLYIMQKLDSQKPQCAFQCSTEGKCESVPITTSTFKGAKCYDQTIAPTDWKYGSPLDGNGCSSSEYCSNLPCKIKEKYTSDYRENYTKGAYCSFMTEQDWINASSRGFSDATNGITRDGGALLAWLSGQDPLDLSYNQCTKPNVSFQSGGPCTQPKYSRQDCIGPDGVDKSTCLNNKDCCYDKSVGTLEYAWGNVPWCYKKLQANSTLETGTLAPISKTNPYPVFFRYYESGFHWKYYMNDNSLLFSTQHLYDNFYSTASSSTIGYDIKYSNCPKLVAYYDTLYNWIWEHKTYVATGFNSSYQAKDGGLCYKPIEIPPGADTSGCAKGYVHSNQKLLPPICSVSDCCTISGATNVMGEPGKLGSCFPGGKGVKNTNPPPDKTCSKNTSQNNCLQANCKWENGKCVAPKNTLNMPIIITFIILGIIICLVLLYIFKKILSKNKV